ncbi:MAG: hypothetical protein NWE95_10405 [Candidatus Bathyarchaeota archaeon]|nr:hypothetical protein [Candidatus Bathyarchaeota archaeon]
MASTPAQDTNNACGREKTKSMLNAACTEQGRGSGFIKPRRVYPFTLNANLLWLL